jgi:uncharacterized protein
MIKLAVWILFLGMFAYCSFCIFLYLRQRSLIFYPHPGVQSSEAETLWLENDGERLKVWHVSRGDSAALIYFGGNAEDVSINLSRFKKLFPSLSLYLMNYRGFGGSSGHPTEAGLYSDGRALYEHIAASHKNIIVMGRSLGTALALHLAAHTRIDGLILVTPYSSMVDLARHYYPFLPVGSLLKDRFDAVRETPGIDVPVLVVMAEHDEVIPAAISEKLVGSLQPETVQKFIIKGTFHNSIDSGPGYDKQLAGFIESLEEKI